MTPETIFSHPVVYRLGWVLLHFIWQGALAGLILAVFLRLLTKRSTNTRYFAACLGLALMVTLPVITFSQMTNAPEPSTEKIFPEVLVLTDSPPITNEDTGGFRGFSPGVALESKLPLETASLPEEPTIPSSSENPVVFLDQVLEPAIPWLVSGWFVGVFILSLRLLGGWLKVQRIKYSNTKPLDSFWQEKITQLAYRLKINRPIQLFESALAEVPLVIGCLKPVILLPACALSGLSIQQLEAIIAHELAHIRRYDYLVNLLQAIVETVLFYHPAVWWVSWQIRLERENCCDDLAVSVSGDGILYAQALTTLEEFRSPNQKLVPAASGGVLFNRIRRLIGHPVAENGWMSGWLAAGVVLVLIGILAAGLFPLKAEMDEQDINSNEFQAWYILDQIDSNGLLHGLTPRLGKAVLVENRQLPMWLGVDEGGSLELEIIVKGDVEGEILIGFFRDPRWWLEPPLQVRSVPGPGKYTLDRLIPGEYCLGAMIGELPIAQALGVHQNWPNLILIDKNKTSTSQLLISENYKNTPAGHFDHEIHEGFADQFSNRNPTETILIQAVDQDDKPVPYCRVTYNPRSSTNPNLVSSFNYTGTNDQGLAYCDKIYSSVKYTVQRFDFQPDNFAQRWWLQKFEVDHRISDQKQFKVHFTPFPSGPGKITGRVHDQYNRPIEKYYLNIRDYRRDPNNIYNIHYTMGYRIPVVNPQGQFEIDNFAPGQYTIDIRPFDTEIIYDYFLNLTEFVLPETGDVTVNLDIEIEVKEILYGQVAYPDGLPLYKGSYENPEIWPEERFPIDPNGVIRLSLSSAEKDFMAQHNLEYVEISDHSHRTLGRIPLKELSSNLAAAGRFVFPRIVPGPSLTGNYLPKMDNLQFDTPIEWGPDKISLIAFWDVNQRPSRNFLQQLNQKVKELPTDKINIITVQAAEVEENILEDWLAENSISLPVVMIKDDIQQTLFAWNVQSLPWLLMADAKEIVQAEGFGVNELEGKIKELNIDTQVLGIHITPTELLDRYQQGQEALKTFICKSEAVRESWSNDENQSPSWTRYFNEIRTDGTRFDIIDNVYFPLDSIDASLDTKKPHSSRHIWDGENFYYINSTPRYYVIFSKDSMGHKDDFSKSFTGAVILGFFYGDLYKVDTILHKADTIKIRDEMEIIGGSKTYVIDAVTAHGRYTLWIDPNRGYNIVKAKSHKSGSDIVYSTTMDAPPPPIPANLPPSLQQRAKEAQALRFVEALFSLDNVLLERIDNKWVPMAVDYEIIHKFSNGIISTQKFNHKRVNINFEPDFSAVDAFIPDIQEGTEVKGDGEPPLKYTWLSGKLVPNVEAYQKPSLIGEALPAWNNINLELTNEQIRNKIILVCFFDINQRSSRNCLTELAKKAEELAQKNVVILSVQATQEAESELTDFLTQNHISFTVGMIESDEEKIKFNWGVKALPWLILTDKEHIVRAEGFGVEELEEKIKNIGTQATGTGRDVSALTGFNIYLLQDEAMDYETARTRSLSDLVLQGEPWIASKDIERYDVSTHCIYLKKDLPIVWEQISLRGTPFLVTADGERCYLGTLWNVFSSFAPKGLNPVIYPPPRPGASLFNDTPDLVSIILEDFPPFGDHPPTPDVRNDPRNIKALKENGQYHAGIQCSLDEVSIISTKEGSSVQYTYTLKNNDKDNLYVLDPDRMNTDYFHYNHNGITAIVGDNEADRPIVFRIDGTKYEHPTPSKQIDTKWFSLLKSRDSMTRTVLMKGYPPIPPGTYRCAFYFASPGYGNGFTGWVSREQREMKDGRIWIGRIWDDLTTVVWAVGFGVEELEGKIKLIVGADEDAEQAKTLPTVECSGKVVDQAGLPVAGAQVALISSENGVVISDGRLRQWNKPDMFGTQIVNTDKEGRFVCKAVKVESYSVVAAHEKGFALVDGRDLAPPNVIRIEKWGRLEGEVALEREPGDNRISLHMVPHHSWFDHKRMYSYFTQCDEAGHFVFEKVPPGWVEVGYLIRAEVELYSDTGLMGDTLLYTGTCLTPVEMKAGDTTRMMLGGSGRPVVGKFVLPGDFAGEVNFGESMGHLTMVRPEIPRPENYDQMTPEQRKAWLSAWRMSAEGKAYIKTVWQDKNRRHYAFKINPEGTFRIEDVIAGKYQMNVHLESKPAGVEGEVIGSFTGVIEVPEMPGGVSDVPLDLGELELSISSIKKPEAEAIYEAVRRTYQRTEQQSDGFKVAFLDKWDNPRAGITSTNRTEWRLSGPDVTWWRNWNKVDTPKASLVQESMTKGKLDLLVDVFEGRAALTYWPTGMISRHVLIMAPVKMNDLINNCELVDYRVTTEGFELNLFHRMDRNNRRLRALFEPRVPYQLLRLESIAEETGGGFVYTFDDYRQIMGGIGTMIRFPHHIKITHNLNQIFTEKIVENIDFADERSDKVEVILAEGTRFFNNITGKDQVLRQPLKITEQYLEEQLKLVKTKAVWGEAVQGVQVRLRAEKTKWAAGEKPVFWAEVRNEGERDWDIYRSTPDEKELVWDGQRYIHRIQTLVWPSTLASGQQYEDAVKVHYPEFVDAPRGNEWWNPKTGEPLELMAGKHEVRVVFKLLPTIPREDLESIRVESNPVEIEILPPEEQDKRAEDELGAAVIKEGRFEWDKSLSARLELRPKDGPAILWASNVQFFEEEGECRATLRVSVFSEPKFKWRSRIELVSSTGLVLRAAEAVSENEVEAGRFQPGSYAHSIHFSLGRAEESLPVERYRIILEPVDVEEEVTPPAWVTSEKLNVVHGRVTGPEGKPIGGAEVQIRQVREPGMSGIAAPDTVTDETGFYFYDGTYWPYRVGVIVYEDLPDGQGYRHQYKLKAEEREGTHRLDFGFGTFPAGTSKIKGKVVDDQGELIRDFSADVRLDIDWDEKTDLYQYGYRIPFNTQDGCFEIGNLTTGAYQVRVNVTPEQQKKYSDHEAWIVQLEEGETAEKTLVLPRKRLFYGRVLFEDGSPAVVTPAPWEGARSSIRLNLGRGQAYIEADGYFGIYLGESEIEQLQSDKDWLAIYIPLREDRRSIRAGRFPFDKLSENKNVAGQVRVKRPGEVETRRPEGEQQIAVQQQQAGGQMQSAQVVRQGQGETVILTDEDIFKFLQENGFTADAKILEEILRDPTRTKERRRAIDRINNRYGPVCSMTQLSTKQGQEMLANLKLEVEIEDIAQEVKTAKDQARQQSREKMTEKTGELFDRLIGKEKSPLERPVYLSLYGAETLEAWERKKAEIVRLYEEEVLLEGPAFLWGMDPMGYPFAKKGDVTKETRMITFNDMLNFLRENGLQEEADRWEARRKDPARSKTKNMARMYRMNQCRILVGEMKFFPWLGELDLARLKLEIELEQMVESARILMGEAYEEVKNQMTDKVGELFDKVLDIKKIIATELERAEFIEALPIWENNKPEIVRLHVEELLLDMETFPWGGYMENVRIQSIR